MEFADIAFPQQLGALTYIVPPGLRIEPGMVVEAPLKRSVSRGIVLRAGSAPAGMKLRSIRCAVEDAPLLSHATVSLIGWLAEYYMTTEGMVLKSIFPKEFFRPAKARAAKKIRAHAPPHYSAFTPDKEAALALASISQYAKRRAYRTYLLEAPSGAYEHGFLAEAIAAAGEAGPALVLAPDIGRAEHVAELLRGSFEGVVAYHSGLSAGKRSDALRSMDGARVVVGSRLGAFAPAAAPSLIAVLSEESASYKDEGGIRFNARDAAVMRGYLEHIPVLLSSICPSLESYHNAERGKYALVVPKSPAPRRPEVSLLPTRSARGGIAPRLRAMAEAEIRRGGRVLFVIRRMGYSMLRCADCGQMPECPTCGVGLEYTKRARRALRCTLCGHEAEPPETCPACGGIIEPAGVGLERIEDELAALNPVHLKPGDEHSSVEALTASGHGVFAVGSKMALRQETGEEGFNLIAVLNADSYMHIPDFRATERAYCDLLHAADALSPTGRIVLQSRFSGARIFGHLKRFDREGFYKEELSARQEHGYPPFWKLAVLRIDHPEALPEVRGAEVLGPLPERGGRWKLLVKAPSRVALRRAVSAIATAAGPCTIDIDPAYV